MSNVVLTEAKRRQLVEAYLQGKAANVPPAHQIVRRPRGAIAPLSLTQEELWRRELRVPEIAPLYNECVTVRMTGSLDVAALERSFTEIVSRHEIWRTSFETKAGEPVQIIHPAMPVRLPLIDLRELPQAERMTAALHHIGQDARRRFDLQCEPPLRPTLARIDDREYRLFLVAHLIVLDGMSAFQLFPLELEVLYRAFLTGRASPLPELPIQCGDFAYWQRECLNGEIGKQTIYWRKQLRDPLPGTKWPKEGLRPGTKTYHGAVWPFALSSELSERLREFAPRANSTLFLTLLSGFAVLLHRRTSQNDIIVGTLSPSGRKHAEVLKLLGYFLNPVALRFDFGNDPTFRELLAQARIVMSEAISNDDVPIEHLARELRQEHDPGPSPFFTAAISLQPPTPNLDLDWSVTTMDVGSGGSPWSLYLAFTDRPQGILGRAQFDPDLVDAETLEATVRDLQALLHELTMNPSQRISDISFV